MSQVSAGPPRPPLPCGRAPVGTGRRQPGSPGLCDLGQPHTLSGPEPGRTDRAAGGHSESRPEAPEASAAPAWALGRLPGGGAWLPGQAWDQQLGAPRLGPGWVSTAPLSGLQP